MQELADRLRGAIADGAVPGAAIVLTDTDGEIALETFGTTRDGGVEVGARTRFRWASCSKPITSVATMIAVQEGLVDLDAPIARYLPGFSVHSRFGDDPGSKITVRHLLSHMAGLTRQAVIDNSYDDWEGHVASISDTWLRFPVGQRYAYSDIGVDLVGRILEIVSGERFPDFVARHVFAPLGMDDATFDRDVIKADAYRAIGHINGRLHGLSGMVPAGSMHASAQDLGAFLQFVLSDGCVGDHRVLSSGLLAQMRTVPFPVAGQVEGYALGLRTRRTRSGWRLGHAGRGFGFLADLWWLPDSGIGAAVVSNSHEYEIRGRIVPQLLERALSSGAGSRLPAIVTAPKPAPATGAPDVAHLAGRYAGGLHQTIVLDVRDRVLGLADAQQFDPLVFESATDAVTMNGHHERYRFVDNDSGPRYVVRVRDGESWTYNDGPNDPAGPDDHSWLPHLGEYALVTRDGLRARIPVTNRNGYLYIAGQRIAQHTNSLFTPRGEHVELDGDYIRVGNRTLERIAADDVVADLN